jgi:hypothetical protein
MKRHGRFVSLVVLTALAVAAPTVAADAARGRYRIELSDGSQWTAVGTPAVHGTVVTFHTANGALVGVPREMIVRLASTGEADVSASLIRSVAASPAAADGVAAGTAETYPVEALQPGDVVALGPLTEEGPTLAESTAAAASATAVGTPAVSPGAMGYGGYGGGVNPNLYVNPNGTLSRAPSFTDLALALAAQTPIASNGFPVMTNGSPTVIGPDGTPTLAPGVPGSATPAIGPNGTPVIGETGPTTFPQIGPNGTPVLAPAGQPGSAPVVSGPNGTPELTPNVATGSTPVVIGPNSTPVLAPAGQPGSVTAVIGPNGTPVMAPSGQTGSATVVIGPNGTPVASPMRGPAPSGPRGRGPAMSGGSRGR